MTMLATIAVALSIGLVTCSISALIAITLVEGFLLDVWIACAILFIIGVFGVWALWL